MANQEDKPGPVSRGWEHLRRGFRDLWVDVDTRILEFRKRLGGLSLRGTTAIDREVANFRGEIERYDEELGKMRSRGEMTWLLREVANDFIGLYDPDNPEETYERGKGYLDMMFYVVDEHGQNNPELEDSQPALSFANVSNRAYDVLSLQYDPLADSASVFKGPDLMGESYKTIQALFVQIARQ